MDCNCCCCRNFPGQRRLALRLDFGVANIQRNSSLARKAKSRSRFAPKRPLISLKLSVFVGARRTPPGQQIGFFLICGLLSSPKKLPNRHQRVLNVRNAGGVSGMFSVIAANIGPQRIDLERSAVLSKKKILREKPQYPPFPYVQILLHRLKDFLFRAAVV